MKFKFFLCMILLLWSLDPSEAFNQDGNAAAFTENPRVLVLHSYHFGFSWSDSISEGIKDVFDKQMKEVDLRFEFLDTRFNTRSDYLSTLKEAIEEKYSNRSVNAVIACDDNALNFMLLHGQSVFSGSPVVFCSVSGYKPKMREKLKMTGLRESIDIRSTIKTALQLHPNTREIAVILDRSNTGRALRRKADEVFSVLPDHIQIRYLEDLTVGALKNRLKALPENSIVLLFIFPADENGRVLSHEKNLERIRRHCASPIYSVWQFYLGHGIVGGRLTDGKEEGRMAAQIAMRILHGEDAADIPLDISPVNHMFDYRQLAHFGISTDQLPEGSIVTNRPFSIYQAYKKTIWIVAAVLAALTAAASILAINVISRKRAEDKLRRLNETLEKRVAKRTSVLERYANKLRRLTLELSDTENRERSRIAMILHEDLQQHLAAIRLKFKIMLSEAGVEKEWEERQRDLDRLLREAIQKCRSLSHELDPPVLRQIGLMAGLNWLAMEMKQKHGLNVEVKNVDEADLNDSHSLAAMLFRSIQELLFNSVKHSGCSRAVVEVEQEGGWLKINVSDRGDGCDVHQLRASLENGGGFGLFSIKERVNSVGGRLEIDAVIEKGFRVTLHVPLSAAVTNDKKVLSETALRNHS